jgi:ribulose 1,5-bisphosphate synthetase/thiazole synthase
LFLSIILFSLCSSSITYDIIVYTATPGGIAADRASPSFKIAIIEPTAYIGGMTATGDFG